MSALIRRRSFGGVVPVVLFVLSLTAAAVYVGSARTGFSATATARVSATAPSRTATPTKVIQTARFTPHGHRWS